MPKGKILKIVYFLIIAAILTGIIYIIIYLNDKDEITLPLIEGAAYRYSGVYITQGNEKKITMVAPDHYIVVDRIYKIGSEKRYILSFWIGPYRIQSFIIAETPEGFCAVMGRNYKVLTIPSKVKRGQKWEIKIGSEKIEGWVGKKATVKTPTGSYKTRIISFRTKERTRIDLYMNKDVGIVQIIYSQIGGGSGRQEAQLSLGLIEKDSPLKR